MTLFEKVKKAVFGFKNEIFDVGEGHRVFDFFKKSILKNAVFSVFHIFPKNTIFTFF